MKDKCSIEEELDEEETQLCLTNASILEYSIEISHEGSDP